MNARFLGDAVLELVVTRISIFEPRRARRHFNQLALSSLVRTESIGWPPHERRALPTYCALKSRGEKQGSVTRPCRQIHMANSFGEAVIGALYLDQGWRPEDI